MFGVFSQIQGWAKIKGGTDGAMIGNISDSLKSAITQSALPTGASTEATLAAAKAVLDSLNAKDFSTQTTLAAAKAVLDSINAKDFATQTTLAALNAKINSLTSSPGASDLGLVVRPVTLELPTFNITAENIVVGNNKSMLAIQNTGTSIITLREVFITNDQTTAVTGVAGEFRLHRITSFTGGTALTPNSLDTNDSLPSGITAAHASTVSGEGVLFRNGKWSTDEWGPGTADVEAFDHAIQNTTPFWAQTANGKGLVIRQNQGVHLRFATNSTAGSFNIRFVFTVG